MSAEKRKRTSINIETKVNIIKDVEKKVPYKDILIKYELKNASNISEIYKIKDKILSDYQSEGFDGKRKTLKKSTFPELDNSLKTFISQCNDNQVNISKSLIKTTSTVLAKELGIDNYEGSDGYFYRFKKRHNLKHYTINGESGSVSEEAVVEWSQKLQNIIKDYNPKDIYNADETGLFWRLMPNKTYSLQNKKCEGGKKSKERVTIMLCTNMDGSEKLKMLFIGKSKNPRCMKKINKRQLPVTYKANKKSWINSELFKEFLTEINKDMILKNRKILLFVDNCTAHPNCTFTNIKLEFLPKNTTSKLQPLDQGIIRSFKAHYKTIFVRKLITDLRCGIKPELKKISILDAINIAKKA
jgi:hypothetical protein